MARKGIRQSNWLIDFSRAHHPPALKRLMLDAEKTVEKGLIDLADPKKPDPQIVQRVKAKAKSFADIAIQAGRTWARMWMPFTLTKEAAYWDWNIDADINSLMSAMKEPPSLQLRHAVHEAIQGGQAPGDIAREVQDIYQGDRAIKVARTIYMNLFAKAALREMKKNGYRLCKRLEIRDHKVCEVCYALNNKLYVIDDLLDLPDPLTHETHPQCRGTFVAVINSMVALPQKAGRLDFVRNLQAANHLPVQNVPLEYVPYLAPFLKKTALPWSVVFDPDLDVDSKREGAVLRVHPRTLFDQDPREVFLEHWAEDLWPKYRTIFEREYANILTKMGLVRPSKTVKTLRDYWISEFIAWKLNQFDTPMEMLWFRTTVKE